MSLNAEEFLETNTYAPLAHCVRQSLAGRNAGLCKAPTVLETTVRHLLEPFRW